MTPTEPNSLYALSLSSYFNKIYFFEQWRCGVRGCELAADLFHICMRKIWASRVWGEQNEFNLHGFSLTQIAEVTLMMQESRSTTVTTNKNLYWLILLWMLSFEYLSIIYLSIYLPIYLSSSIIFHRCIHTFNAYIPITTYTFLQLWAGFVSRMTSVVRFLKFSCLPRTTCLFNFKFILILLYT